MSATAADGFFMKFHLRWGGCGVIWGGLSPPKPKPSYVPEYISEYINVPCQEQR